MIRKHPMRKQIAASLMLSTMISGCDLSPDFKLPEMPIPQAYKEQPAADALPAEEKGNWKKAEPMEETDRGQWWKTFGDEELNALQQQAVEANQSLKAAAARVEQSRSVAETNFSGFFPDLDIGVNAVRSKPSSASQAAFGQPGTNLKPYTIYSAQGVISYEADLFGRIRNNYRASFFESEAEAAQFNAALLALQADVASHYFSIRALDSERGMLRDTVKIREKAMRIMQKKYDVGAAGEQDLTRIMSELAISKAELVALDRQRNTLEHSLAVLLGKMPADFTLKEAPLMGSPPEIPAGLPSSLLERRPDIAAAQAAMQAANSRIGQARAAFFPSISLTSTGGYESTELSDIFKWSNRTWALGQLAGTAVTLPIFEIRPNLARLDRTHSAYDEAVANYRQGVLVAFRDVEDNLSSQRLLAMQSQQQDAAAAASGRTSEVIQRRYEEGDVDFFEVVNAERDAVATGRASVQVRGQRYLATIGLIRALGGGWDVPAVNTQLTPAAEAPPPAPQAESAMPQAETAMPQAEAATAEAPVEPVVQPVAEPEKAAPKPAIKASAKPAQSKKTKKTAKAAPASPAPETTAPAVPEPVAAEPAPPAPPVELVPQTPPEPASSLRQPLFSTPLNVPDPTPLMEKQ
jgi:outer membrane protein, multidrug efflux system